jgi:galactonate dehydratase
MPVAPAISAGPLAIAGGKLWRLREPSGRQYSVIRLDTRGGLRGYGEAGVVEVSDFRTALTQVQGKDATAFEVVKVAGPLRGAINMAMLDIVGKATQAPVYQVVGGPTRHKARGIATVKNSNNVELAHEAGFRAFAVPLPPPPFPNSGKQYVNLVLSLWEELQKSPGDYVLDAGMQLTPGDAQMVAAALEKEHPLFLDEPCRLTNLRQVAKISEESVTPLGFGRELDTLEPFFDLLREQAGDSADRGDGGDLLHGRRAVP